MSRVVSIDLFDPATGEEITSLEHPVAIIFDAVKVFQQKYRFMIPFPKASWQYKKAIDLVQWFIKRQ